MPVDLWIFRLDDLDAYFRRVAGVTSTAERARATTFATDRLRLHYLITKAEDFEKCWPVVGKVFGTVRPAIVVMVVGLTDPRMKIEIEVTALLRGKARKSAPKKKKATKAKRKK